MDRLQFTEDLLTNISDVDGQHRELFAWGNLLIFPGRILKTDENVAIAIVFLSRYARYHFLAEEQAMERFYYDRLEDHKKEHRKFRKGIKGLYKHAKKEGTTKDLSLKVHSLFSDLLTNHIKDWDHAFSSFLREQKKLVSFRLAGLEDLRKIDILVEDELDEINDKTASQIDLKTIKEFATILNDGRKT